MENIKRNVVNNQFYCFVGCVSNYKSWLSHWKLIFFYKEQLVCRCFPYDELSSHFFMEAKVNAALCLLTNVVWWRINNTLRQVLSGTILNSLRCFEIYPKTFVTQTISSKGGNDRKLAGRWTGHSRAPGYTHRGFQSALRQKSIVCPSVRVKFKTGIRTVLFLRLVSPLS